MYSLLLDTIDFLQYDLLRRPLPKPADFSDDKLKMTFELHKEKKGLWVEAKEYPGLIASGDNPDELREALFDSILTYFDVPRAYAKRINDNLVLNLPNGKSVVPKDKGLYIQVAIG